MDFDELFAQVLEAIQREGRVSYRALKMRFDIDDEYLDVLKEELIDAQRLATDEDGKIMVWAGEMAKDKLCCCLVKAGSANHVWYRC